MGCYQSKMESEEAVARCRDRHYFMKQAVSVRNAFAAANSSYATCLKNAGAALTDFAQGDVQNLQFPPPSSSAAQLSYDVPLPPPPVPDFPSALRRAITMPDIDISYVKCIKTRLETIKKKRIAVQKFMKSDIAELLKRGLYYDAYKRVDGLVLEQNMLFCYELIEKFIGCISDHVEDLTKQSDCPEECKQAVPSLMYAAARISDLPELRHLRTLFSEKFGNSLEPYTSKEFVEKLRRDPPTREMKIRLLYDIAQEFSIEWDPKETDTNASKGKERYTLSQGRKDFNDDSLMIQYSSSSEDETSTDASSNHGRKASSSSFGSIYEDEVEIKRPNSFLLIPPPYLKQKTKNGEGNFKKTTDSSEVVQKKESNQNQQRRTKTSHVRGTSLPNEPTISVETSSSRGHARTISLDTQMQGGARRVHPNLPDYDELVARLKALRWRT